MQVKNELDLEKTKRIILETTKFHLRRNKTILAILRIAIFIITVFFGLNLIFNDDFKFWFLIVFIFFGVLNILTIRKVQLRTAVKAMENLFRKPSIDKIIGDIKFSDTEYSAVTTIGNKKYKSCIKYSDVYYAEYNAKVDCMIFTTGKLVSNYFKSKPRSIYLGNLEPKDKETVIGYFHDNSSNFCLNSDLSNKDEKPKERKRKRSPFSLFIIVLLVGLAIYFIISPKPLPFNIFYTYDYDIPQLMEEYEHYEVNEDMTRFMALTYEEDSEYITLSTYFFEENTGDYFATMETDYCDGRVDKISENIEMCHNFVKQYGFICDMKMNIVIRLEKETSMIINSDEIDFSFVDIYDDYDYYIGSYYGSAKDDVIIYINDTEFVIN